jgi:hypothetical protein
MTESEDNIESYWEVVRPHLIEKARQRRAALLKNILKEHPIYPIKTYKIIREWDTCEIYKELGSDGYSKKW